MSETEQVVGRPEALEVAGARLAEVTAAFLGQAAGDPRLEGRLRRADTSVHLHLGENDGVTILLDQTPIAVHPRIVGAAEVELWCSPEILLRCARGQSRLPMEILKGDVAYRGPVRKFLTVLPILRTFDVSVWSRRRLGF